MSRRVVVTGLGLVSALGNSVEENWNALEDGTSGIKPISTPPYPASFPLRHAGEITNFKPREFGIKPKSLKVMNPTIQYALAASWLALKDAGVNDTVYNPEQIGITLGVDGLQYTAEETLLASYEAVGNDMGNYLTTNGQAAGTPIHTKDPNLAIHPLWPLSVLANMALCHISIQHNLQGPNLAFSSLDVGGSQAIGEAFHLIRQGDCDVFIAGGSYGLNTMHMLSLASLNAVAGTAESGKPFGSASKGCVPGEGAAIVVLEELNRARKRNARIYAEISGYGTFFNGSAQPDGSPADQRDMLRSMQTALDDAGIAPADIDYVNTDGKGLRTGDDAEIGAVRQLFGGRSNPLPASTCKQLTGHMLAAAGAFDAVTSILALEKGCIPGSGDTGNLPPDSPIQINKKALKKEIKYAISNTFGLTGENTSLVFNRYH